MIRHLAIRAPNWVGDLVMATPVLGAAAGAFERVSVLVRERLAPVLRHDPAGYELEPLAGPAAERAAYRTLAPDAALLLSSSFGAALRAWRARVPIRAGAALAGRRALLTHAVVPPTRGGRRVPIPTAHLLRDVAGLVGLTVDDLHPRLAVGADDEARAAGQRAAVGVDGPYAVCAPGAAFGAAKLWPPERFGRVLAELRDRHGLASIVTGAPGEEPLLDAVAGASGGAARSLAGVDRDLGSLKSLVRDARLVVVGDSGPRWYAAAFDVPCVTVMGPNYPELTATSLERCAVVRRDDLECSPCLRRVCPLDHHRCLAELPVQRVLDAVEGLLARAG